MSWTWVVFLGVAAVTAGVLLPDARSPMSRGPATTSSGGAPPPGSAPQQIGPSGMLTVTAQAFPAIVEAGQTFWLNATVSGGVAPYTYKWSLRGMDVVGCSGANVNVSSVVCSPSSGGNVTGSVRVNDSSPTPLHGSAVLPTYLVSSALSIRLAAPHTSGPAPLTVTFAVQPLGGHLPYTAIWTSGDGASGAGLSWVHTYSQVGTFAANVTITDGAGAVVSGEKTIVVTPPSLGRGFLGFPGLTGYFVLAGIIALGAAVLALAIWYYRRRPPRPEPRAWAPGSDATGGRPRTAGPPGPSRGAPPSQ